MISDGNIAVDSAGSIPQGFHPALLFKTRPLSDLPLALKIKI